MAKRILFCPNCMARVKKNDTHCSSCGISRKKMEEMIEAEEEKKQELKEKQLEEQLEIETEKPTDIQKENDGGIVINTSSILEKQESGEEITSSDQNEQKPKRHKHKAKKTSEEPQYTIDDNGEFNIDTSDVTYLEGVENPTYSVKKARGEVTQEKLKWWEIYKWADRMLAKRKIMKEVNKASHAEPVGISRFWMITLCILFGWMGAHNFYCRNWKKGTFVACSMVVVVVVLSVPVLTEIMGVFVGGGLGFVVMALWINDLIGLIFHTFRYRISKEEFISNLNVETRAKIGKKYINLDRVTFKAKEQKRREKILRKQNKRKKRASNDKK